MASALAEKTCTPCRGGVPPLSPEEAEGYRAQAPDWALVDDATRIERRFRFKDFREAFAFVARAAELVLQPGFIVARPSMPVGSAGALLMAPAPG